MDILWFQKSVGKITDVALIISISNRTLLPDLYPYLLQYRILYDSTVCPQFLVGNPNITEFANISSQVVDINTMPDISPP
jgi:hypothetical protein